MTSQSDVGVVPTWNLTDRLRKARVQAGLTQDELAERTALPTVRAAVH